MNDVIIINKGKIKFTKMQDEKLLTLLNIARVNNLHYMVLKEIKHNKTYTVFFGNVVSFKYKH